MTKKKIFLYGHLADKYPHSIEVEASTVAEAIRSLSTIEELTPPNGEPWPITIKGVESEIALYSETSESEIHIYPRVGGSGGRGGFFQIVLGITLIAIAIWNPAILATMKLGVGSLYMAGGMMIAGGLLQMMMPTPSVGNTGESESSKYLGATGNTVQIGTRIPLAYGNNKLSGHYLSFDVDAVDSAGEDFRSLKGLAKIVGSTVKAKAEREGEVKKFLPKVTGVPDPEPEPDPGDVITKGVYIEYDKTPIAMAVVNPIYTHAVASPTNTPTSGWNN